MSYLTYYTDSRKVYSLPLSYQMTPKLFKSVTVGKLIIPDLRVGDLVQAFGHGQAELLAPPAGPDRAMLCRYLKASRTDDNAHTEGLMLAKPMGVNFTQGQHYGLQSAAGSFVVTPEQAGTMTVMLVMYAAALSGVATDPRSLPVSYSELRVDVHKPDKLSITVNGNVVF